MAVSFLDSFNVSLAVAGTTIVRTGYGFAPKAFLIWCSGRTEAANAVGDANYRFVWGAGTSPTSRFSLSSFSEDATASGNTASHHADDECLVSIKDNGTKDGELDVQSMDSDGITFVIDTVFTANVRVHVLAFGGSDITQATTFTFNRATALGDQDATTTLGGATPSVAFMGTIGATAVPSLQNDSPLSLGYGITSAKQGVLALDGNNAASPTQTIRYCTDTECLVEFNTATTDFDARATFKEMIANGFRLTWNQIAAGAHKVSALVIVGGTWTGGPFITQTDLVTSIVLSGFGFAPKGAFFASHATTESVTGTVQDTAKGSLGAATSAASQAAHAASDRDARGGFSQVAAAIRFDEVYANINEANETIQGLMKVTSFDSDGITLLMDDADPAANFGWFVAVGATTFPQAVAGTLTDSGALTKKIGKALAGDLTSAGAITKQVGKSLTGTLTDSGALTRSIGKSLAAALSSSGALTNQIGKALAGALSSSGATTKQVGKGQAGQLDESGNLTNQAQMSLTGSLASSGEISKQIGKQVEGSLSPFGDLMLVAFHVVMVLRTLTFSGVLSRSIGKGQAGQLDQSGNLTNQAQMSLQSAFDTSGELPRQTGKSLQSSFNTSGDLSTVFIAFALKSAGGGFILPPNFTLPWTVRRAFLPWKLEPEKAEPEKKKKAKKKKRPVGMVETQLISPDRTIVVVLKAVPATRPPKVLVVESQIAVTSALQMLGQYVTALREIKFNLASEVQETRARILLIEANRRLGDLDYRLEALTGFVQEAEHRINEFNRLRWLRQEEEQLIFTGLL